MTDIKIKFAFLCDDTRKEDNGKLIFIGAYNSSMIVQNFPAAHILCLVMNIHADEAVETSIGFRIFFNEHPIAEGGSVINLMKGANFSVFPGVPLNFERPGLVAFQAKFGQADWEEIISIEVIPSQTSNASAPPA